MQVRLTITCFFVSVTDNYVVSIEHDVELSASSHLLHRLPLTVFVEGIMTQTSCALPFEITYRHHVYASQLLRGTAELFDLTPLQQPTSPSSPLHTYCLQARFTSCNPLQLSLLAYSIAISDGDGEWRISNEEEVQVLFGPADLSRITSAVPVKTDGITVQLAPSEDWSLAVVLRGSPGLSYSINVHFMRQPTQVYPADLLEESASVAPVICTTRLIAEVQPRLKEEVADLALSTMSIAHGESMDVSFIAPAAVEPPPIFLINHNTYDREKHHFVTSSASLPIDFNPIRLDDQQIPRVIASTTPLTGALGAVMVVTARIAFRSKGVVEYVITEGRCVCSEHRRQALADTAQSLLSISLPSMDIRVELSLQESDDHIMVGIVADDSLSEVSTVQIAFIPMKLGIQPLPSLLVSCQHKCLPMFIKVTNCTNR